MSEESLPRQASGPASRRWKILARVLIALWMAAVVALLVAIWHEASDISMMLYGIKEHGLGLR